MNNFIGRKNELDFLEQKYKSENGQLVIIYGRRRIGKTETIKQFCNDKSAVFFTCTQTEDKNQLKNFSSILLSNNLPQAKYISEFNSWEQAFLAIKDFPKLEEKKQIIVIDEFPYMVKGNSEIPSVLQKLWDAELKNQNIINFSQLLRNAGVNRNNFMLWLNDHDRFDGTKYRVSEKSLQKVIDQLKELRVELKKIK